MAIIDIPTDLVQSACQYTGREPAEAVCYVLSDYPRLISDLREARRRLLDFDNESENLDSIVDKLNRISLLIQDL